MSPAGFKINNLVFATATLYIFFFLEETGQRNSSSVLLEPSNEPIDDTSTQETDQGIGSPVQSEPPNESTDDTPTEEVLPPLPPITNSDDSDLSDVEKEKYCDDSAPPRMSMKLQSVQRRDIKDLFKNSDLV